MSTERLPFTVIGGYLGAGKTTLLNHILRHNQGRRFALLVNDFGGINIDAELIEHQDGDTIELANGCICCSLVTGFVVALKSVLERVPLPDHIIVEASGVSDPAKIAQYGQTQPFYLDGIIVVADAETIQARARDKYVSRTVLRQLESADLLVLNKTDLVTPHEKQTILAWLAEIAPRSRVIEAEYGKIPMRFLLGPEFDTMFDGIHHGINEAAQATAGDDDDRTHAHENEHDHSHEHSHDEQYVTWSLCDDMPMSRQTFEATVMRLPDTVIRGKGFVYLDEEPEQRWLFQLVGHRWTLQPDRPWGTTPPETRVVFIGVRQDEFN